MNLDSCPYKVVAITASRAFLFRIPEGFIDWDGCLSGRISPGTPPNSEMCVIECRPEQWKGQRYSHRDGEIRG